MLIAGLEFEQPSLYKSMPYTTVSVPGPDLDPTLPWKKKHRILKQLPNHELTALSLTQDYVPFERLSAFLPLNFLIWGCITTW